MRSFQIGLQAAMLLAAPGLLWASEHLDGDEALKQTVSLEGLSGISLVFAQAYNQSPWLYAVCCTATMAVVGVSIALLADVILKTMGMQVGKIEHKE